SPPGSESGVPSLSTAVGLTRAPSPRPIPREMGNGLSRFKLAVMFVGACGGRYYDEAPPVAPVRPAAAVTKDAGAEQVLAPGAPDSAEQSARAKKVQCDGGDFKACNDLGQLFATNSWGARDTGRAA